MAYFDHNATAPLSAVARDAWLTAQSEAWHNPGAGYRAAAKVRASLELERERIAALLGAEAGRLVVTSGATEAANAVFAHLASRAESPGVVLLGATEHSCVRASAEFNFPGRVERLAHDAAGRIEVAALCARLREGGVAAVAVMAANNESGVLQPWRELAVVCAERGVPYVCDAVQWLGRLPAAGLGATDFLFASAHKFGGPKGVGLLLLPAGAAGRGFVGLRGGGQQEGRRSGTENWPALAATGAALAETDSRAHGGATAQEPGGRQGEQQKQGQGMGQGHRGLRTAARSAAVRQSPARSAQVSGLAAKQAVSARASRAMRASAWGWGRRGARSSRAAISATVMAVAGKSSRASRSSRTTAARPKA